MTINTRKMIADDLRKAADAIEKGTPIVRATWGFEHEVDLHTLDGNPRPGPTTFKADIKFGVPV